IGGACSRGHHNRLPCAYLVDWQHDGVRLRAALRLRCSHRGNGVQCLDVSANEMTPSRKKPGVAFWATVVLVVGLALLAGYGGSYLLIVEPAYSIRYYPLVGPARLSTGPHYHAIGKQDFWRSLFAPAHSLDQRIRPETWASKLTPVASPSPTFR
ncbi:MAG: hypothetical protein ACM3U2_00590, partial [Deltaproteobacteria bacterium]